jgi:hypothetical protein
MTLLLALWLRSFSGMIIPLFLCLKISYITTVYLDLENSVLWGALLCTIGRRIEEAASLTPL